MYVWGSLNTQTQGLKSVEYEDSINADLIDRSVKIYSDLKKGFK